MWKLTVYWITVFYLFLYLYFSPTLLQNMLLFLFWLCRIFSLLALNLWIQFEYLMWPQNIFCYFCLFHYFCIVCQERVFCSKATGDSIRWILDLLSGPVRCKGETAPERSGSERMPLTLTGWCSERHSCWKQQQSRQSLTNHGINISCNEETLV